MSCFQLPPVKAYTVYSKPKGLQNQALFNTDENLWNLLQSVVLKTNHRQGEGVQWTKCLNRLRVGEMTEEDVALLETRRLKHFPNKDFENACHAFGTNFEMDEVNMARVNNLPGTLVQSRAKIECPKSYKPPITDHGTIDNTKFKKNLKLKVGARVMLIHNVSLSDKMVNGVIGNLIDIVYHTSKDGEKTSIRAFIVKFDDPQVGEEIRTNYQHLSNSVRNEGGVPIFLAQFTYNIPGRNPKSKHGAKCIITQFPLRLAFAFTAHKLQGVTLKRGTDLIVHKMTFNRPGMGYVMLSRCEDINNIFLDNNFELKSIIPDEKSLEETRRLERNDIAMKLAEKRFDIYYQNICSIWNKMGDLQSDILPQQSDYICLVETWLEENSEMHWPGKKFYQVSAGRGKGVCLFAPENGNYRILGSVCKNNFQILSVLIREEIQLFIVYLSEGCNKETVAQNISDLQQDFKTVVLGDFNFDKEDPPNALTNHFKSLKLRQIVSQPTQEKGRTIDQCFVSEEMVEGVKTHQQFTYYSDHASFTFDFNENSISMC